VVSSCEPRCTEQKNIDVDVFSHLQKLLMVRRCLKNINRGDVYWIQQAWEVDQAKETGTAMENVTWRRRKTCRR